MYFKSKKFKTYAKHSFKERPKANLIQRRDYIYIY